jgi:hypothetical protein
MYFSTARCVLPQITWYKHLGKKKDKSFQVRKIMQDVINAETKASFSTSLQPL